jgi:hypothetical protein
MAAEYEDSWFGDDTPVAQPSQKPKSGPKMVEENYFLDDEYIPSTGKAKTPEEDAYLKQFQESQAGVLGSAAGQLAAAQLGAKYAKGGAAALEQQQQGALGQLRSRSGQAFAAQQARGGGGSLAGMRQSQLSRGIAEGQVMGDFAMQKMAQQRLAAQAQKEAAQAAGEFATTQQKLKQAEADRAKTQVLEQTNVEKDIRDAFIAAVDAEYYWSEEDAKRTAQQVRDKYKNYPAGPVKDRAMQMADDIEKGVGEFEE